MSLETQHPGDPYSPSRTACQACGAALRREPCGCWTDRRGTRWCEGAQARHMPGEGFGEQPENCQGVL